MPLMPTTIISTSPIYPTGLVVISDIVLQADTASFDISDIPGTYKHLMLMADLRSTESATFSEIQLRFNNDSGGNYEWHYKYLQSNDGSGTTDGGTSATSLGVGQADGATADANKSGALNVYIPNYAGTAFYKNFQSESAHGRTTAVGQRVRIIGQGVWKNTTAVTRVTLLPGSGNWLAGSRLTVYGLGGSTTSTSTATVAADDENLILYMRSFS